MMRNKGLLKLLFSPEGRINRLRFFLTNIFICVCIYIYLVIIATTYLEPVLEAIEAGETDIVLLADTLSLTPSGTVLNILAIYICFVLTIKRLHDMNLSGFYSLLLFVPLINIILAIILFFKKGTIGSNNYGEDPLAKS